MWAVCLAAVESSAASASFMTPANTVTDALDLARARAAARPNPVPAPVMSTARGGVVVADVVESERSHTSQPPHEPDASNQRDDSSVNNAAVAVAVAVATTAAVAAAVAVVGTRWQVGGVVVVVIVGC